MLPLLAHAPSSTLRGSEALRITPRKPKSTLPCVGKAHTRSLKNMATEGNSVTRKCTSPEITRPHQRIGLQPCALHTCAVTRQTPHAGHIWVRCHKLLSHG